MFSIFSDLTITIQSSVSCNYCYWSLERPECDWWLKILGNVKAGSLLIFPSLVLHLVSIICLLKFAVPQGVNTVTYTIDCPGLNGSSSTALHWKRSLTQIQEMHFDWSLQVWEKRICWSFLFTKLRMKLKRLFTLSEISWFEDKS